MDAKLDRGESGWPLMPAMTKERRRRHSRLLRTFMDSAVGLPILLIAGYGIWCGYSGLLAVVAATVAAQPAWPK